MADTDSPFLLFLFLAKKDVSAVSGMLISAVVFSIWLFVWFFFFLFILSLFFFFFFGFTVLPSFLKWSLEPSQGYFGLYIAICIFFLGGSVELKVGISCSCSPK